MRFAHCVFQKIGPFPPSYQIYGLGFVFFTIFLMFIRFIMNITNDVLSFISDVRYLCLLFFPLESLVRELPVLLFFSNIRLWFGRFSPLISCFQFH